MTFSLTSLSLVPSKNLSYLIYYLYFFCFIFFVSFFLCHFHTFVKSLSRYIEEWDLLRFMIEEEAELVWPLIDVANTGKVDRKTLTEWVVRPFILCLLTPASCSSYLASGYLLFCVSVCIACISHSVLLVI